MILIPVILFCLTIQLYDFPWVLKAKSILGWIAGWTFAVAAITDFFDGHIARKRNIVTIFGSLLDPMADKFLTVSSLIALQALGRLSVFAVIVLVLREVYISSLRLLALSEEIQIPVDQFGKYKTATLMVGIPLLMAYERPYGLPMPEIGHVLLLLATFLSLYSSVNYSIGLIKKLKLKRKLRKRKKFLSKLKSNHKTKVSND